MEGFLRYEFGGGLLFGGAYTQRGLFSEFYGKLKVMTIKKTEAQMHTKKREKRKNAITTLCRRKS